MKRILVLLIAVALVAGGCGGSGGGGEPSAPATAGVADSSAWQQPVWSPPAVPPSVPVEVSGCAAARAMNIHSAISDFAAVGIVLSTAQDGPLSAAGIRLAAEALNDPASRTAVYSRFLDVLTECLRVSP